MADNTILNTGSGGDTLRTDDNAGIKTPVTKIELGADGTFSGFVSATNPMPAGGNTAKDGTGTAYALLVDTDGNQQVDIVGALPAGTNAIGKLAANSGVDIGDVDVTSLVPGTGATSLGKATDSAAGGTDTGVATLGVRDDALSALTPVEGDYVPLRLDANGAVWTIHSGAVSAAQSGTWNIGTVTTLTGITNALPAGTNAIGKLAANSGVDIGDVDVTSVIAGTGATNLGKAVDSAAGGTDTGVATLGVRDDALSALTPIEGDYVPLRVDANGAIWTIHSGAISAAQSGTWNIGTVTTLTGITNALPAGTNAIGKLAANSGVDIGDVDVTSVIPGTGATNLGKATDAAAGATDTGIAPLAIRDDSLSTLTPAEGDYVPLRTNSVGALWTAIDGTPTISGAAAHDAAVSGNPLLTGAEARSSEGTAVASGDVVRLMADLVGKVINQPYAPTDLHWQATGSKTDTTELTLKAAGAAGIRNYLTDIICVNTHATTNTTVIIKDGASGTEIARLPVPANGGVVHRFAVPLKGTAATALVAAAAASVTTIYITATGYQGR